MNMKVHLPNRFAVPPIRLAITTLILVAVVVAAVFIWQAVKTSTNVPAPTTGPPPRGGAALPKRKGLIRISWPSYYWPYGRRTSRFIAC
jgi:hypothetical protein